VPVMAHVGFTPQSEHGLGGYRVQGRGTAAEQVLADAHAVEEAGAFAVVLEMVPAAVAKQITAELRIPTIGIGAGPDCDAQVLVWQDMAGLREGQVPRFVKRYADVRGVLTSAAKAFAADVVGGVFPSAEHAFEYLLEFEFVGAVFSKLDHPKLEDRHLVAISMDHTVSHDVGAGIESENASPHRHGNGRCALQFIQATQASTRSIAATPAHTASSHG